MSENTDKNLDDIELKRREKLEQEEKIAELVHASDLASIKPSHYMKNSKLIKKILRLKTVLFDKDTMNRVQYMREHSENQFDANIKKKKKNKNTVESGIKDIFNICKEGYRDNAAYRSTVRQSILRGSVNGFNGLLQQGMMLCLTGAAAHSLPVLGKLSESAARLTAFVGLAIPSIRGAMGDMVNTSYQIKAENLRNSVRSDTQFAKIKKLWEEYPMLFVKGNNHEELKAAIQTLSQERGNILSQSSFFVGSMVSYLIAAGVIAYNNPTIAAMSMAVSAASGFVFSKAMGFFDKSAQRLKNKSTRYAGVMGDVMQHLGLVKQNNIGDNIDKKFSKAHQQELERTNALSKQRSKLVLRMQMALYAAVGLGTAIYASAYCQTPESAAMALGMTTSALTTLFGAIGVVNSYSNLRTSLVSYKAMSDKLNVPEKMQIREGNEKIPYRENNTISVRNIRFVYPNLSDDAHPQEKKGKGQQPQMDIDNLEFTTGKLQCIVGKSGNGKSTLINLLTHTYDVNNGEVKINGINVQDTSQRELMEHICWQDQNSNFFETYTVKENMEVFIPSKEKMEWAEEEFKNGHLDERTYNHLLKLYEHPQEMIDEALKKAHVYDEYYSVRDGKPTYDTQYDNLSKGQQQRLALARAFLSNRDIYIFDEPTDSLDPISTQQITDTFKEMAREGKNVIVITHSPQIMAQADQVTVIENMRVTGNGTPEELRLDNDYLRGVFPKESDIYSFRAEAARSAHDEEGERTWGRALNETRMAEATLDDIRFYMDAGKTDVAEARMHDIIDKIRYLSDEGHKDTTSEKGTYIKIGEMISADEKLYQFYLETATKGVDDEHTASPGKENKADKIRAYKEQARKDGVKETMDYSDTQSRAASELSMLIAQSRHVH